MDNASELTPFVSVPAAPSASIGLNLCLLPGQRSAIKAIAEMKPAAVFFAQIKFDAPNSRLVPDSFPKLLDAESYNRVSSSLPYLRLAQTCLTSAVPCSSSRLDVRGSQTL